jgi:kinesin family protein 6/9
MTSVLRDSLGGNCMTTMIATCSVEKKNLDVRIKKLLVFLVSISFNSYNLKESISTCRFAQRVALIKNEALVNEELDPKLVILKLKNEIDELKNQLSLATGNAYQTSELSQTEIEK